MFHLVARALPGRWLFHDDLEGRALWLRLARLDGLAAACLMPDHVHLVLAHADSGGAFGRLKSAYARARGPAAGPLWAPAPPAEPIPDELHLRRTLRYVHLNPCRAGLVNDPLSWPFSTHRDAVGLAAAAAVRPQRSPESFHAYVSGDPTTSVTGTPFPHGTWGTVTWAELREAVAGVCRVTLAELEQAGAPRRLLAQAAWIHGMGGGGEIAAAVGAGRGSVWRWCRHLRPRGAGIADPALRACVAAVGDPRFRPLSARDCRRDPAWLRYRSRRSPAEE